MSLCLTRGEIAELTRAKTRKLQVAFFRIHGIRHYVDHNGWPVVTRAAVEGEREPAQDKGWTPRKAAA